MINPKVSDRIKRHFAEKAEKEGKNFDVETFDYITKLLKPSLCNMLAYYLDCHEMKAKTEFTNEHIVFEVSEKYEVSEESVKNALYRKDVRKWIVKIAC